jgi:hypothetical protein
MVVNAAGVGAWSIQSKNTALQGRLALGSFLPQKNDASNATTPLTRWKSGVIVSSSHISNGITYDGYVAQNTGLSLFVYPLSFAVDRSGQGPYLGWVQSVKTVTLDTAHATLSRRDLIIARVYDAALGDTVPGTGNCQLEVVTGTASGSPATPATPTGAIALAYVAVAPLAASIVQANIIDLRNGISSNGGVHPMLPGDLLADPGYYHGQMRYRKASGSLPELVDVWGSDGQWHGTQSVFLNTVQPAGLANITASSTTAQTLSIPDPGWPYRIRLSGSAAWLLGSDTRIELRFRNNSTVAASIIGSYAIENRTGQAPSYQSSSLFGPFSMTFGGLSPVLTGARTIYMQIEKLSGSGNGFTLYNGEYTVVDTEIVPA